MRKFHRSGAPSFLAENCAEWGKRWAERKAADKSAAFIWHVHAGRPVNHQILEILKPHTQHHCSFCDNFPMPTGVDTIEHFRPKGDYPLEAYVWENLYYCCPHCQAKYGAFDELLLKPDAPDYSFDRYFRWDFLEGTIHPNELSSQDDQARAEVTIRLYRLNVDHPKFRLREARARSRDKASPLDDWAYRDFFTD